MSDRRSNPERTCIVCLQGQYVARIERDTSVEEGKDVMRMPWHIEACNRCGHVQIFRRDWGGPSRS
jgi:hypothetical protein